MWYLNTQSYAGNSSLHLCLHCTLARVNSTCQSFHEILLLGINRLETSNYLGCNMDHWEYKYFRFKVNLKIWSTLIILIFLQYEFLGLMVIYENSAWWREGIFSHTLPTKNMLKVSVGDKYESHDFRVLAAELTSQRVLQGMSFLSQMSKLVPCTS